METQRGEKIVFRWATLPGMITACLTGLLAFYIVYSELTIPIPGLPVITDPREIAVLLGAAASGPIGAALIGILAGAAVPDGNAAASMTAHALGAVLVSVIYRQLSLRLRKSIFRFALGWALIAAGYFYLVLMPAFILTHNLYHPLKFDFGPTYVRIASGALQEAAATVILSTLIIVVLPRRYRRPLWGN
jgi:hypothetical protein